MAVDCIRLKEIQLCEYVVFVIGAQTGAMPRLRAQRLWKTTKIHGARGVDGRSNGVADYVAQEELERAAAFWISTVLEVKARLLAMFQNSYLSSKSADGPLSDPIKYTAAASHAA